MSDKGAKKVFDPLDMSNYSLEKFKEIKAGIWMERIKFIGMPLAILLFLFFHLQWVGPIEMFDTQTKVPPANCYSATGIFLASLVLWLTEAIPNYLTSLIVVVTVILTGTMKMRPAFAMLGEPVMILNIASFIMASALGKRLVRTVLIFTESSDQLSRATDRVPGLPASPGYVQ